MAVVVVVAAGDGEVATVMAETEVETEAATEEATAATVVETVTAEVAVVEMEVVVEMEAAVEGADLVAAEVVEAVGQTEIGKYSSMLSYSDIDCSNQQLVL